jgi:hypothetical protein
MAPQTVEFRSRFSQHTLTRVPRVEGPNAMGQRTVHRVGERIQFAPAPDGKGGLEGRYVARVGRNTHEDSIDWLKDTEDPEIQRDEVDALKAHREFGSDFWVAGWSPVDTRQLPRPQDFRKDVTRAAVALDADAVQVLLDEELATHGRGDLVQFARDTLETIQETQAALAEGDAGNAENDVTKAKK